MRTRKISHHGCGRTLGEPGVESFGFWGGPPGGRTTILPVGRLAMLRFCR